MEERHKKEETNNGKTIVFALFLITGCVFVSTCWRNKLATREGLFEELSDYELIVKEFDPSIHSYSVGYYSIFARASMNHF